MINKIKETYKAIVRLVVAPQTPIMAQFDLKTAISLLPVVDDSEEKILQLIDPIELYEQMLDPSGISALIKFVLKTRLSSTAKLRLNSNYNDVAALVTAMKTHLLRTKTDTALQVQLLRAKQGMKSIEEFGKELEKLFVDLTISKANGNNDAYKILKPINEKNAIKRFADGLHDQRISTIITARNFSSLKDAIQTVVDEETTGQSSSSTNPQIFFFHRNRGRGRNNFYRGNNNNYNNQNHRYFPNNSRGRANYNMPNQQSRGTYVRSSYNSRGNAIANRGRSGTSHNGTRYFAPRGRYTNNQHILYANDNPQETGENSKEMNWFFRS